MRAPAMRPAPFVPSIILAAGWGVATVFVSPWVEAGGWPGGWFGLGLWYVLAAPIVVSAALGYYSWARVISLEIYVAALGMVFGVCGVDGEGLIGLVVFALLPLLILEWASRLLWCRLRVFSEPLARAWHVRPMSGWEFEFAVIPSSAEVSAPSVARTVVVAATVLCVPALIICAQLPQEARTAARARGARWADADWKQGELPLVGSPVEEHLWTRPWLPSGSAMTHRGSVLREQTEAGYREEMARIMRRESLLPVTRYLFTGEELEALVQSDRWLAVRTFPMRYGGLTVDEYGGPGGERHSGSPGYRIRFALVVDEKAGALVTVSAYELIVRRTDGHPLQSIGPWELTIAWDIDAIQSRGTWVDR